VCPPRWHTLVDAESVIAIDGVDVRDVDLRHLRAKVNYVNQRTQLFNATVLQNVRHGNPRVTAEKLQATLQKSGLDVVFHKLKHGIHTEVGMHDANLLLQTVTMLLRDLRGDTGQEVRCRTVGVGQAG
jgi:ABC-type bacteriocin/lantibiotic exporter with double-glycine peptidase domain